MGDIQPLVTYLLPSRPKASYSKSARSVLWPSMMQPTNWLRCSSSGSTSILTKELSMV